MKRFWLVNKKDAWGKMQPAQAVITTKPVRRGYSLSNLFISFIKALLIAIAVFAGMNVFAQQTASEQEAAYRKVITERSAKIINTLEITDSARYYKVLGYLVNQYASLNKVHEQNKKAVLEIKQQSLSKEVTDEKIRNQEEKKSSQLLQLHKEFLTLLKYDLNDEQVEKIKDGMTYRVFPITYTAYLDMIPSLTPQQKEKIYNWLKEARELAMDEGSSEDKHKVFGKYKGRINNYLSSESYDLKKEEKEWQERRKKSK